MSLIDQRILIPAPTSAVWEIIANHQHLPRWRRDCRAVSILTTTQNGPGARRRISPQHGPDFIEEFRVWYNGLGYEYTLVDVGRYKHYLARVRLQATPDGTIVQWTVEFKLKGFLARLLGQGRHKNKLEKLIADSLRELYKYVMSTGAMVDLVHRQKAGVQDAPDVAKRMAYGAQLVSQQGDTKNPTGPMVAVTPTPQTAPVVTPSAGVPAPPPLPPLDSQLLVTPKVEDTGPSPVVSLKNSAPIAGSEIVEPPVRVDDTPSIARVKPPSFITDQIDVGAVRSALEQENKADSKITEPPIKQADTKPAAPVDPTNSAPTFISTQTSPFAKPASDIADLTAKSSAPSAQKADSVTPGSSVTGTTPLPSTPELPKTEVLFSWTRETPPLDETVPERPAELNAALKEKAQKTPPPDAPAEKTIWEVFGVQRPSDTPSDKAQTDVEETKTPPTPSEALPLPPTIVSTSTVIAPKSPETPPPISGETNPASSVLTDTKPDLPPWDEAKAQTNSQASTLDEILALEEPPLPGTASTSVKTIVRQSTQPLPKAGLRKKQGRDKSRVRPPKR